LFLALIHIFPPFRDIINSLPVGELLITGKDSRIETIQLYNEAIAISLISLLLSFIIPYLPRAIGFIGIVFIAVLNRNGFNFKRRIQAHLQYRDYIALKNITREKPLDYFLLNALYKSQIVMLSMADRKVYIGYITGALVPIATATGQNQELEFTPIASGYRDDKTLEVEISTNYVKQSQGQEEYLIILRQENIVSAVPFNIEHYTMSKSKVIS
jgi:hypothetical protein